LDVRAFQAPASGLNFGIGGPMPSRPSFGRRHGKSRDVKPNDGARDAMGERWLIIAESAWAQHQNKDPSRDSAHHLVTNPALELTATSGAAIKIPPKQLRDR
jgi:hypothetical protein